MLDQLNDLQSKVKEKLNDEPKDPYIYNIYIYILMLETQIFWNRNGC